MVKIIPDREFCLNLYFQDHLLYFDCRVRLVITHLRNKMADIKYTNNVFLNFFKHRLR